MKNIPIRKIKIHEGAAVSSHGFDIRDVACLLGGKDMHQELHKHDFFYMLALKKGRGVHEIDFTSYQVSEHTIFLMRPGQVHRLELSYLSAGYLIEFNTDFYSFRDQVYHQQLRKASATNKYKFDASGFKSVLSTLENIFKEHSEKRPGFHELIKASLAIVFIELGRHGPSTEVRHTKSYRQEKLEIFLELLEINIFKLKHPTQYAELMNLSLYQLNSITKEVLGKTSSELINDHIILEAKRCLLATSGQINQIANRLGYEDVSYFIRFFRKHTGHSPEGFRENFK